MRFLESFKNRPEKTRRIILFMVTSALTAIVLILWLYGLNRPAQVGPEESPVREIKPFNLLKDNLKDTYQTFRRSLERL